MVEDWLGSTRDLDDGATTDTNASNAFGNTWTPGTSGTTPTPFGFAARHGYQSDADTGLMLLGHRYYDASTGRFISRDPIRDGYNWFAYCDNDPVNAVDPQGLSVVEDFLGYAGSLVALMQTAATAAPAITTTTVTTMETISLLFGLIKLPVATTVITEVAVAAPAAAGAGPFIAIAVAAGTGMYFGYKLGEYIGDLYFGPETYESSGPIVLPPKPPVQPRDHTR